jgi:putative acetyltransferase
MTLGLNSWWAAMGLGMIGLSVEIREDDLSGSEVAEFLAEHIEEMQSVAPRPESKHALDLEGLRAAEITFWTVWDDGILLACGALKDLGERRGEIKSMRTSPSQRRKGVASKLLDHILGVARERGYRAVSLETGSYEFFAPARALYERFGFEYCARFGDYIEDPYSVFMTKRLD